MDIVAKVEKVVRRPNTPNGNPVYRFHLSGGVAIQSKADAAFVFEGSPASWEGKTFNITIERHRVIDMTEVK